MTTATTPASYESQINGICDILRRSNCTSALQYIPELTWILFLRILDARETRDALTNEVLGLPFTESLECPYRWQDWAEKEGEKRRDLQDGAGGGVFRFVNDDLLPYLQGLNARPNATVRQKVVSEIMSGVERVRVDTERNFLDVLDAVDAILPEGADLTENSTLSQAYESLLLKMGEKNNDGGQFFTPREVIKAIVETVQPKVGETVYDPGCGTGGFLAQSYHYMRESLGAEATGGQLEQLATATFYGREKENLIYPIALANLVLNGIDRPNLWHGNTLTGNESYGGLYQGAPALFDVVLMNPPFGGKEGSEAQIKYPYKTMATQVLVSAGSGELSESRWAGRHRGGRGTALPHQRKRLCPGQAVAAGRVRPVLHYQPARWRVHRGWGRRQDQPAFLQQRAEDGKGLVLRPFPTQSDQAASPHSRPL